MLKSVVEEKVYDLLDEPSGLVMVDVGGKNCLIDTGSPFLLGDEPLSYGGVVYNASPTTFLAKWNLDDIRAASLCQNKIDFVVGTDVLCRSPFTINRKAGTFTLGALQGGNLAGKTILGVPYVNGLIDSDRPFRTGIPTQFMVDTGAAVTFVPSGIKWSADPLPEAFKDFYPLEGWFEVPQRKLRITAFGHQFEDAVVADFPSSLDPKGLTGGWATAILGMSDVLREGCLGFDLQKGFISFEKF